jgi:hypothetical protein
LISAASDVGDLAEAEEVFRVEHHGLGQS